MSVCEYHKKENILHFKNMISQKDCKHLTDTIDKYKKNGKTVDYAFDNNIKCDALTFQHIDDDYIRFNCSQIVHETLRNVVLTLPECLKLIRHANYVHDIEFRKIYGATRCHIDGVVGSPNPSKAELEHMRVLSVIIALNSDYEGGEICFPEQDFKIKLKAGEVLAFPPYWTHPHYSNELKDDTYRYTITTWFCE